MARGSHASQPAWSYVAANASQPVLEQTLGDALRLAVKTWPSKPALIQGALETSERRKWTFQDLIEQSEQVARALLSRFEPGDHVKLTRFRGARQAFNGGFSDAQDASALFT